MLRSTRSPIIKRVVLLAVMLGMLGFFSFGGNTYLGTTLGVTQEVSALPCHEVENYYYNNSNHDVLVGYRSVTCSGVSGWGIITDFRDSYDGDCCRCCGGCEEWCWEE